MNFREEEILERFNVKLEGSPEDVVVLNSLALERTGVQDILEKIGDFKYTRRELEETKDILTGIQDRILSKESTQKYIEGANRKDVAKGYIRMIRKKSHKVKIKICKLINKLLDNARDASNEIADSEEVEYDYNRLLKACRVVAEVLNETTLELPLIQESLNMIAGASMVCFAGCKDRLLTLIMDFGKEITEKYKGIIEIDNEQDKSKRLLKEVFFKARKSVAMTIESEFFKQNEVFGSMEPHYKALCDDIFNKVFEFNIPYIYITDTVWEGEEVEKEKDSFMNFIKDKNINLMVYNEASKFLYDELTKDARGYEILVDWGKKYIVDNNLNRYISKHNGKQSVDVVDFLCSYVMTGENNDKPRYVALREMIKHSGFVSTALCGYSEWDIEHNIESVVHDIKTEDEIQSLIIHIKDMLEDVEDVFEEDTLKQENFKRIDEIFKCVDKSGNNELKMRTIEVRINFERRKKERFFVSICERCSEEEIQCWMKYMSKEDMSLSFGVLDKVLRRGLSLNIVEGLLKRGANANEVSINGTPISFAIHTKNLELLKLLIKYGADVDTADMLGRTTLMFAIYAGDKSIELVKLLIDSNVDINAVDNEGSTALMLAIYAGDKSLELMKLLIDSGADVNAVDIRGNTALMRAICAGGDELLELVELLLENGAYVNMGDAEKNTALMRAVYAGDRSIELVELLIKYGADVNAMSSDGRTVLMKAIYSGYRSLELTELLIRYGANVNAMDMLGGTVLMCAVGALNNSLALVNLLIDNGANVNATDILGNTALMRALERRVSVDIIRSLIANGAYVNLYNDSQRTALNYAVCDAKYEDILEELIVFGSYLKVESDIEKSDLMYIFVNSIDINGVTPLIDAIESGASIKMINTLIKYEANINSMDNRGLTVLMHAVLRSFRSNFFEQRLSSPSLIKLLIDKGVDVNTVNGAGFTALSFALMGKIDLEDMKIIVERSDLGLKDYLGNTVLTTAIVKGADPTILDIMLRRSNLDITNNIGQTALMVAAVYRVDTKILKSMFNRIKKFDIKDKLGKTYLMYFLESGVSPDIIKDYLNIVADVDSKDCTEKSVLMYAMDGGVSEDIINILIDKGADVTERIKKFETLLIYAVQKKVSLPVIKILLDKGIDVNARDVEGRTALMRAIESGGSDDVINELLDRGACVCMVDNYGKAPIELAKECKRNMLARKLNDILIKKLENAQSGSKRERQDIVPEEGPSNKRSRGM